MKLDFDSTYARERELLSKSKFAFCAFVLLHCRSYTQNIANPTNIPFRLSGTFQPGYYCRKSVSISRS